MRFPASRAFPHWKEFLAEVTAAMHAGQQLEGETGEGLARRWMFMLAEDEELLALGFGREIPMDPQLHDFLRCAKSECEEEGNG